jgi:hypothetical protein
MHVVIGWVVDTAVLAYALLGRVGDESLRQLHFWLPFHLALSSIAANLFPIDRWQ